MKNWINSKENKTLIFPAAFLCLLFLAVSPAFADYYSVVGTLGEGTIDLNDDAFVKLDSHFNSSAFSDPVVEHDSDGLAYGSIQFSQIPYFEFNSTLYFQFIFDSKESNTRGTSPEIWIDDIVVSAGLTSPAIWSLDQSIILNAGTDPSSWTESWANAGGDMALYVPVYHFAEMGLTGSDYLYLAVEVSYSDNGSDKWLVLAYGTAIADGGYFFDLTDSILDPNHPVPIPSTMLLLGSGLAGLGLLGFRRRKRV